MELFNTQTIIPSTEIIILNLDLNDNKEENNDNKEENNNDNKEENNDNKEENNEDNIENIQHSHQINNNNNNNNNDDDLYNISDDNVSSSLISIDENKYDIGNCPFEENCPIKIAMDNGIRPRDVRYDPTVRNHINTYHSHLNCLFSSEYINRLRYINLLDSIRISIPYDISNISNDIINNTENETKENIEYICSICKENYDNNKFFMSCCATSYCTTCIQFLKTNNKSCPSCDNKLEYLKDIKISFKSEYENNQNDEDCFICCEVMNSNQYNGKIKLECICKIEICITCAYKSLHDSVHTKMESVQGIPGLIIPQTYTVKGSCPQCKQVPSNKDEICSLYGFLPPRM